MLETQNIKEFVRSAKEVYIATINEAGYPITRVMFNLHSSVSFPKQASFLASLDEDFCLYLGTNTSSAKVADSNRMPKISAYFHTQGVWEGLLVAGEAEIVGDMAIKRGLWQDEWSMYYSGGVESEDFTLIRIKPKFAEYYHDLTKETFEFAEGRK